MPKTTRSIALVIFTAGVLALASAPLSAGERLRPGEWEYTIVHAGAEPHVFKHCVTADEAKSINGDTASARAWVEKKAAGNCTITSYDVHGDTVSYAMTCGPVSIRAKAVFHGDTSEGEETSKNGSAPEVVSHLKSRRLGDCP